MQPTAADAPDPLVGNILADRYRILGKLGEGAMGAVYLGEHLRMGRRDAIKVLRGGLAQDAEAIARFTRGARNVASIRHPNVCAIYDFSDTGTGLQYLAMEFIEGETLRDTLEREGRLDPARAVFIACEVAAALQAAHDAGVVHRDLKPGNIMLCPKPDGSQAIKVVDFDIAKGPGEPEGDEVTRVGFVVGTPEYMSPEQLTGDRLDGRSDLYSLGVVLFRMLTGALPYRAVSTQEIMMQRLTTDALLLSDVVPGAAFPPALENAIARSLSRVAAQRQQSAAAFAAELRAAVGMTGPQANAPAMSAAPPRSQTELPPTRVAASPVGNQPKRRSMAVPALLGTAVVVALGIGATMFLRDGAPDPIVQQLPPDSESVAPPVQPTEPAPDVEPLSAEDPPPGRPDPVAQQPAGTRDAPTTDTPRTPARIIVNDALFVRLLERLRSEPPRQELLAIHDTAALAWDASITRRDSADAAFVLAQAAFILERDADCARWTRRGAALDPSSGSANSRWAALLEWCQ